MIDFSRIQYLLSQACPHDTEEITPEKHLVGDLDLDSFGMMDMVTAFESEFGIDIPDADLHLFDTVSDITDYLQQKTSK